MLWAYETRWDYESSRCEICHDAKQAFAKEEILFI